MEPHDRLRPDQPRLRQLVRLDAGERLKAMGNPKYQEEGDPRTSGPGFAISEHPSALDIPRRWSSPRVIFVNSMSDLFTFACRRLSATSSG